ncbi:hypothetical protein Hdeb2414_s0003g00111641 [Helianthus debilis subsp. tardiflorus]
MKAWEGTDTGIWPIGKKIIVHKEAVNFTKLPPMIADTGRCGTQARIS